MKRFAHLAITCITLLGLATTVVADNATAWTLSKAPEGSRFGQTFVWDNPSSEITVTDPIVYPHNGISGWTTVPQGPTRFTMIVEPTYSEPAAVVLEFTNTPVHCATSVGFFAVDSGTGAFLTRGAARSIDAYLPTLAKGWSLYDGLWYDQSQEDVLTHFILKMPGGADFPAFITGGDGGFDVVALKDGEGNVVGITVPLRLEPPEPACPT